MSKVDGLAGRQHNNGIGRQLQEDKHFHTMREPLPESESKKGGKYGKKKETNPPIISAISGCYV